MVQPYGTQLSKKSSFNTRHYFLLLAIVELEIGLEIAIQLLPVTTQPIWDILHFIFKIVLFLLLSIFFISWTIHLQSDLRYFDLYKSVSKPHSFYSPISNETRYNIPENNNQKPFYNPTQPNVSTCSRKTDVAWHSMDKRKKKGYLRKSGFHWVVCLKV